jgi:O-antigen ligase
MLGRTAQTWLVVAALVLLGAFVAGLGALGAAIVLALAYYVFCLARPDAGLAWSFLALPATIPLFQVSRITFQPFELFVWPACLIALISSMHRSAGAPRLDQRRFVPLLAMCSYFMVAALILWGDRTLLEFRMWGGALVFAWSCFLKAGSEEFQTHLWRALATSAVLLFSVALSQRLFGVPLFSGAEEARDLLQLLLFGVAHPVRLANITFQHFNSAGAYLTLVVLVLYSGTIGRSSNRRTLWVGIAAALLALYLTYSRGAALSTLSGALIATALTRTNRRAVVALSVATAVGVALTLAFALPAILATEYTETLSFGVRLLIWGAYLQAWLESPIIGLGPGNGFAAARFLSPYGEEYGSHNNFLYIAADFGVLGLLALTSGLGGVILRTLKLGPSDRRTQPVMVGATAALVALFVHSFFDHTLTVFAYRVALLGLVAVGLGWTPREAAMTASSHRPSDLS